MNSDIIALSIGAEVIVSVELTDDNDNPLIVKTAGVVMGVIKLDQNLDYSEVTNCRRWYLENELYAYIVRLYDSCLNVVEIYAGSEVQVA